MNDKEIKITYRKLPHWSLNGATYFITFNSKYRNTFTHIEKKIIYDHIWEGNNVYYNLISFVVMPDHVHLVLCPIDGYDIQSIARGIKGVSARKINKHSGLKEIVWQSEYFDRIIRNEKELNDYLQYIYENPYKKGLAESTYEFYYLRT